MQQLVRFVTGSFRIPTVFHFSLVRWHWSLARPLVARQRVYLAFVVLAVWLGGSGVSWAQTVTNTTTSATFLTIQAAINDAGTLNGHTLSVAAGTYNENVTVNKSLTIISVSGKGATIVTGSDVSPGTFNITVNNVTIGSFGKGFTINGFDGSSPGIERAAVYLTGVVSNVTIRDNNIVANGEAGLLTEVVAVSNLIVNANIFSGKTFTGVEAGDCGFSNQNTATNVPRQLVVLGQNGAGATNVTFTSNVISGTAGSASTQSGCTAFGQGNTLVTIDANNAVIRGNTFAGTTTRFGTSLRARGTNVSVSCNTFDNAGLGGANTQIFFGASALTGVANPNTIPGVASQNTFPNGGAYRTSPADLTIYRDLTQASSGGATAVSTNSTQLATITNTNTGEAFCSIQSAIDDANTINGHTIQVGAGTYAETVLVNKSLTINGPNSAISPNTGARVAEAIITGGLNVDNAASKTLVVSGFSFSAVSSPFNYNGNVAATINADLTFSKNRVSASSGQLAVLTGTASNTATIVVNDSRFLTMTTNAMQLGGGNVIAQITQNVIDGTVNAGINTDAIINSNISSNTITNTTQQGIQVAGLSSNVTVAQNVISNANTGNSPDRGAIRFRGANLTGPLTIVNNSITGSNNGIVIPSGENITGKTILVNNNSLTGITGLAIKHLGTGTLNATCNWYGTVTNINTLVSGPVTFTPFLTNGTDDQTGTPGFQPVPNSCSCPVPTVSLSPASTIVCTGTSVTLTATPATPGSYTYTFSAGATQGGGGLTDNTATVNATGTYSVTITNANGCTAVSNTSSVTVSSSATLNATSPAASSVVCEGSTVVVPVTVTGAPTGFQWYQNGVAVTGQNTATLTLGNIQPIQAGSYSLVVVGICYSLTTSAFVLTVNPAPTVTLIFNNSATVMGTGIPTITVPPGPGQFFQVLGGTSYKRVIILDRINGYEIRQVDENTTGVFAINTLGLFTITVTNGNGCSRTVQGILANP